MQSMLLYPVHQVGTCHPRDTEILDNDILGGASGGQELVDLRPRLGAERQLLSWPPLPL